MAENRCIPYAAVIERAGDGYSAHVPDLPGCIATVATVAGVKREITQAIRFHVDGLRADGGPVPAPATLADSGCEPSRTEDGDPFAAFTEWSGEIDEAACADL